MKQAILGVLKQKHTEMKGNWKSNNYQNSEYFPLARLLFKTHFNSIRTSQELH
jgi:hypothetical protein